MANPKVTVEIDGKDKLSPVIKKVEINLKDMGEKVSDLGMRMGAAFTVPIAAAGALITKFGADSAKAVADVQKELNDALAGGDANAIAEARKNYAALSPEVVKAADAFNSMQASLKPAMDALDGAKVALLQVMARVLIDMSPYIIKFADGLANMVTQFANMPVPMQNFIIGLVGFVAIVPAFVVGAGQILSTIGLIKEILIVLPGFANVASIAIKGLGTAFGAASLPLIGLTAGVLALKWLFDNGWVERAITAFKQLGFVIAYAWTQLGFGSTDSLVQNAQAMGLTGKRAKGGSVSAFGSYLVGERGPEILNMGASGGSITPNYAMGGAGGGVTIVYSPIISTASTDDIERMGKLIEQAQRRRP